MGNLFLLLLLSAARSFEFEICFQLLWVFFRAGNEAVCPAMVMRWFSVSSKKAGMFGMRTDFFVVVRYYLLLKQMFRGRIRNLLLL